MQVEDHIDLVSAPGVSCYALCRSEIRPPTTARRHVQLPSRVSALVLCGGTEAQIESASCFDLDSLSIEARDYANIRVVATVVDVDTLVVSLFDRSQLLAVKDEKAPTLRARMLTLDVRDSAILHKCSASLSVDILAHSNARISCEIDARTTHVKLRHDMPPARKSLVFTNADGEHIYVPSETGRTHVFKANPQKLEVIADCGHLSTMERPEAVNRALRAWLTA